MSNKIAKTIARQKQKIAEGQYYEAHQQLRVITSRYLKANDYASATDILESGALLLLGANQPSSGGDLALTLLKDVYLAAPLEVNDANRSRLLEILRAFPSDDPLRKRFITEAVSWSVKAPPNNSENERGDATLHHEIGSLLAEKGDAYEAERHLLLGLSPQSASPLATVHYKWYTRDNPHTAALYASRSVLPYLILGNLQNATTALAVFTSQLLTSPTGSSIPTQTIDSQKSSVRIFPSLPLLNFLSLLLLAAQRADAALFRSLAKHYASHLKEVEDVWGDSLAQIGEIWFGIRLPKQGGSNPLMDMMGSMLFGGGGSSGAQKQQPRSSTPKPAAKAVEPKPPAAMDLD